VQILKQITALVFWFFLWSAIPAALLWPMAVCVLKHTQISEHLVVNSYIAGVIVLFFPTGILVDFLYRRFISNRRRRCV